MDFIRGQAAQRNEKGPAHHGVCFCRIARLSPYNKFQREKFFRLQHKKLIEEFNNKYKDKVSSELKKEVNERFGKILQNKLEEEKKIVRKRGGKQHEGEGQHEKNEKRDFGKKGCSQSSWAD